MNPFKSLAASLRVGPVLLGLASLLSAGTASELSAQIVVPAASRAGDVPTVAGTGLHGEAHSTGADTGTFAQAMAIVDAAPPFASFLASTVDYPKGAVDTAADPQTVAQFLGADAASILGDGTRAVERMVFVFRGYIAIRATDDVEPAISGIQVRFGVGSDDGFRLIIGDVTICEFNAERRFSTTLGGASFEQAGLYPIELVYWERSAIQGVEFISSIAGGGSIGGALGRPFGVPQSALYPDARIIPASISSLPAAGDAIAGASVGQLIDGVFLPPGTPAAGGATTWNNLGSRIGFFTPDLHEWTAATVQGDGDDTYVLNAFPAGPDAPVLLWSVPLGSGTGMRTRPNDGDTAQRHPFATAVAARSVGIDAASGSAPYALSEVALYGRRDRLASTAQSSGTARVWSGPNGAFGTGSNWVGGVAPLYEDDARFDAADPSAIYSVTLSQTTEVASIIARRGTTSVTLGGFSLFASTGIRVGADIQAADVTGGLTLAGGVAEATSLFVGVGNPPSRGEL